MSGCSIDEPLRDEIVAHLEDAVAATAVEETPFPYFTIRGFFPRSVYTELLERLPDLDSYEPFDYEKHANQNGESNRRRFCLENSWLDRLDADAARFWCTVRSALGSVELKRAVFDSLQDGLAFRYGCSADKAADRPGYALPELFRETSGYRIKPHPDTRKKVVTMQIALPPDAGKEAMGTEFYRRILTPAAWLREPRGFEIVKTMPFVPNTAYAFVVLNTVRLKSWHGRSTLASAGGVRDSLLNIWYEKAEHGNQDILAEQSQFRSARAA